MNRKETECGGCGLESTASGAGPEGGSCKHGIKIRVPSEEENFEAN
jgi:hypothetical protein